MAIHNVSVGSTPNNVTVSSATTLVQPVVVTTNVTLDGETTKLRIQQNEVILRLVETPVAVSVQPATISVISACQQGPAGADGKDGTGAIEISAGPILPTATTVVDFVALATYRSVKWIVTITDAVANLYRSYEVLAIHNGTTALHSVYGRIGNPVDVTTDVVVNGANLELQLTNNDINNIDIKAQRIVTTI